jgi:hypothetical protein
VTGENDGIAIWGLVAAVALGVVTARWWLVVPAAFLLVICVAVLISANVGRSTM